MTMIAYAFLPQDHRPITALLADRGYGADAIRAEIAQAGVQAVILAKRGRRSPSLHDRHKYRLRSRTEQLFSKLKNWRRVATRYNKTRESYPGFVSLAAVKLWSTLYPRGLSTSSQQLCLYGVRDPY